MYKKELENKVGRTGYKSDDGKWIRMNSVPVWECKVCGKKYQKKAMAIVHVANKHNDNNKK